jgi:hypothetical protein
MRLRSELAALRKALESAEETPAEYAACHALEAEAEEEALAEFWRGGTLPPHPPCPSWLDQEDWSSRQRVGAAMMFWARGDEDWADQVPGLTTEELEGVAGYRQALLVMED